MVDLTGGVLLEATGNAEYWYYPNLRGSTAAEASSTGTAVGGVTLYDPFGNAVTALQADSPDGLAYGFEGKNGIGTDTDNAGIVLMGARLYDPSLGRFLQVDPVPGGSCNTYDYVCQDPVNNVDLNGQDEVPHWVRVLMCLIGLAADFCSNYGHAPQGPPPEPVPHVSREKWRNPNRPDPSPYAVPVPTTVPARNPSPSPSRPSTEPAPYPSTPPAWETYFGKGGAGYGEMVIGAAEIITVLTVAFMFFGLPAAE
jgi:RHS repeat-associated protein